MAPLRHQDVIHGTGSDFNTDTSAAADQVYDAVQTINRAMSGLLDEVDRLTGGPAPIWTRWATSSPPYARG
ncbi:MAG: hypothetical protein ACLRIS_06990 [Flavonifractor plautii]